MSRLQHIREARRPKMHARALLKGPQGSGKTWTALSLARYLAGEDGRVVLIDTERESSLTYADVFRFEHLPWAPPFDAAELTTTLAQLGEQMGDSGVVVIDSTSHFWQGTGGILDVANGRVQGGWDKARPIQNAMVEQFLAMPCHLILCARMKNSVQVSDNGKSVEALGLTIIQSEDLEYELNVVFQLDVAHNATVTKSRTPAVPVGRTYPAGHEKKLAADYDEWLAGGVPPAQRQDVDRIVGVFGNIADKEKRAALKAEFITEFGMPHSLTADAVPLAFDWLAEKGYDPTSDAGEATPPPADQPSSDVAVITAEVAQMSRPDVVNALADRELATTGAEPAQRRRLVEAIAAERAPFEEPTGDTQPTGEPTGEEPAADAAEPELAATTTGE